jgi:hypothetical protein
MLAGIVVLDQPSHDLMIRDRQSFFLAGQQGSTAEHFVQRLLCFNHFHSKQHSDRPTGAISLDLLFENNSSEEIAKRLEIAESLTDNSSTNPQAGSGRLQLHYGTQPA